MKIGRNDLCPCGSGKKYKYCCLNKKGNNVYELIKVATEKNGYSETIQEVLCNLYRYIEDKQWWGACHATCSALYVILSELGYEPRLCIGEVYGQGLYFDHSWIELDGKIIDFAINKTLLNGKSVSGPILFGKDIYTGEQPVLEYGVPGRGIEGESLWVISTPFTIYMDNFPNEVDGLWGVVRIVLNRNINIEEYREKYMNVKRELIRI